MLPNKSNYYADAEPSDEPSPAEKPTESPESEKEEGSESETAEIPKTALGGDLKPGEQITLEVVQSLENSYLVKKSGSKEEEQEAPPPEAAPPQAGGMSSMLQ